MSELMKILSECIELSFDMMKNFSLSEYSINEGEVKQSMEQLKRATATLKTCQKDCFLELAEELGFEIEEVDEDLDKFNLMSFLSEFGVGATMLLKVELGEEVELKNIAINKIKNSLGKVYYLSNHMFD